MEVADLISPSHPFTLTINANLLQAKVAFYVHNNKDDGHRFMKMAREIAGNTLKLDDDDEYFAFLFDYCKILLLVA